MNGPIFLYNYLYNYLFIYHTVGCCTYRNTQLLILCTLVQFYVPPHGYQERELTGGTTVSTRHLKTVIFACVNVGGVIGASAEFFCHVRSLPLAKNALDLPSSLFLWVLR